MLALRCYFSVNPLLRNWWHESVFLDHQGAAVEELLTALEKAKVPPLLVVDHHKPFERLTPEFRKILETGATATIYACFLERRVIELDKTDPVHTLMATALLHGILTDTDGFVQASPQIFTRQPF